MASELLGLDLPQELVIGQSSSWRALRSCRLAPSSVSQCQAEADLSSSQKEVKEPSSSWQEAQELWQAEQLVYQPHSQKPAWKEHQDGGAVSCRETACPRLALQMLERSNSRKTRRRKAGPLDRGRILSRN